MECQALEAIYGDDYKRLEGTDNALEVTLVPETGADEEVNHVSVAMKVVYSKTYPETAPEEVSLRIVRKGALTEELVSECETQLRDAAGSEDLLGTAMVYALAEKCIEWLVEHNQPELDMHAEMMQRLEKEQQQQQLEGAVDVSDGSAKGGLLRDKFRKGSTGTGAAGTGAGSGKLSAARLATLEYRQQKQQQGGHPM